MKARKLTELAMLTALALIIFIVELQIPNPFPIPGVKLGLSNIITVYAVYHYRAREVFLIVLIRILLGSFFSGNMMALMYSMAGGMLCLLGMLLYLPFLLVSGCLTGAFTGGCAQLVIRKKLIPQGFLWD